MTVTGTGLTEVSAVRVASTAATITSKSATELVFSAPALACGAITLDSASQPSVAGGSLVVGAGCVANVAGIEFAQALAQGVTDPRQRLVTGKETWVRAYVVSTQANVPAPLGPAHRLQRGLDPRLDRHGGPRDAAGRQRRDRSRCDPLQRGPELQRRAAGRLGAQRAFGTRRGRSDAAARRAGSGRRNADGRSGNADGTSARTAGFRRVCADDADRGSGTRRSHAPLPDPARKHHGHHAGGLHADQRDRRARRRHRVVERTQ